MRPIIAASHSLCGLSTSRKSVWCSRLKLVRSPVFWPCNHRPQRVFYSAICKIIFRSRAVISPAPLKGWLKYCLLLQAIFVPVSALTVRPPQLLLTTVLSSIAFLPSPPPMYITLVLLSSGTALLIARLPSNIYLPTPYAAIRSVRLS